MKSCSGHFKNSKFNLRAWRVQKNLSYPCLFLRFFPQFLIWNFRQSYFLRIPPDKKISMTLLFIKYFNQSILKFILYFMFEYRNFTFASIHGLDETGTDLHSETLLYNQISKVINLNLCSIHGKLLYVH